MIFDFFSHILILHEMDANFKLDKLTLHKINLHNSFFFSLIYHLEDSFMIEEGFSFKK